MFSQGKGHTVTGQDDTEEKVSKSVKVRQFVLQKVIVPFVRDLRVGGPNRINERIDDATFDRTQVVLKLDSDITFLPLLKRTEIMSKLAKLRINIEKVGTGFTDGSSVSDRCRLFANTKHN